MEYIINNNTIRIELDKAIFVIDGKETLVGYNSIVKMEVTNHKNLKKKNYIRILLGVVSILLFSFCIYEYLIPKKIPKKEENKIWYDSAYDRYQYQKKWGDSIYEVVNKNGNWYTANDNYAGFFLMAIILTNIAFIPFLILNNSYKLQRRRDQNSGHGIVFLIKGLNKPKVIEFAPYEKVVPVYENLNNNYEAFKLKG